MASDQELMNRATHKQLEEGTAQDRPVGLLDLLTVLLRRWKLVITFPFVFGIAAIAISLLLPHRFTATATFVPESRNSGTQLPSGLAGIAMQFGIANAGGSTSPRFYANVLRSRTLRDQLLLASFHVRTAQRSGGEGRLLDYLDVEGTTETELLEDGRKVLDDVTSITVDDQTSIVSVSVELANRQLAAEVANHYIILVNQFNLESRRSNAQERREFAEARLMQAESELVVAEESLRVFLERNRQFSSSPQLQFQFDRLQRQVDIKQEVLTVLRRQYEEARIQEVNDTPVLTVIDYAVAPVEKSSPARRVMAALAILLGGMVGIFSAFGTEYFRQSRKRGGHQHQEFLQSWEGVKGDIQRVIGRRRSRG